MNNIFLITFLLILLISCGVGNSVSGIDYNDFRAQTKSTAGLSAIDCGNVEIGENQLDVNTCSANNFNNNTSFFATYRRRGIDSGVAGGIAFNKSNGLYFLHFDSDPSGGARSNNGKITSNKCNTPSFSGSVDNDFEKLFSCN